MLKVIIVVGLFLCFQVSNAVAGADEYESCRCKNKLATKGDSKVVIQQKCGPPLQISYNVRKGCSEMWLYNFGPSEFMQGICFERGNVQKVLSLTPGY